MCLVEDVGAARRNRYEPSGNPTTLISKMADQVIPRSLSTTDLVGAESTVDKPPPRPTYGSVSEEDCEDSNNAAKGGGNPPETNDKNDIADGYNVNALVFSIKGDETVLQMISQIILPFLLSGFGMVGAGMVLDIVQHWQVFQNVNEFFIVIPALLGLKGNLGMTLASRLSSHAHLGHLDDRRKMRKIIVGNVCLVHAQSVVLGFLAALTAMIIAVVIHGTWNVQHGLILTAASVFSSVIPSLVQCGVMSAVVLLCRRFSVNPDNVATPIAGTFGDLVTLSILAGFGNMLYLNRSDEAEWLSPLVIAVFVLLLPVCVYVAFKNSYTREGLYNGWLPTICAMLISSIGGLVLDVAVADNEGFAVYSPLINGIGGNLVALLSSRLCSCMHQKGFPLPERIKLYGILNVFKLFLGEDIIPRATRVLVLLTVPAHLLFIWTIVLLRGGHLDITALFNAVYLLAALLQVISLLYISAWIIPLIWVKGGNPDDIAIPYLTALGDMLGNGFLALGFHFLVMVGDHSVKGR